VPEYVSMNYEIKRLSFQLKQATRRRRRRRGRRRRRRRTMYTLQWA